MSAPFTAPRRSPTIRQAGEPRGAPLTRPNTTFYITEMEGESFAVKSKCKVGCILVFYVLNINPEMYYIQSFHHITVFRYSNSP